MLGAQRTWTRGQERGAGGSSPRESIPHPVLLTSGKDVTSLCLFFPFCKMENDKNI